MVWFKSCPRCTTGDLSLENDMYGWHVMCLACGFDKDIDDAQGTSLAGLDQSQDAAAA
jgi:uncharacterized protein (DUF983 family)